MLKDPNETQTMSTLIFPGQQEISRIILAEIPTREMPVSRQELPIARPVKSGISPFATNVLIILLIALVILLIAAIVILILQG